MRKSLVSVGAALVVSTIVFAGCAPQAAPPGFLRQVPGQDVRFTTGLQQEAQLLAQGERSLSLYLIDSDTASMIKEGAPIKAVSMKDGVLAQVMAIGMVKDGPHPNAARVFLNWVSHSGRPEGQRRI